MRIRRMACVARKASFAAVLVAVAGMACAPEEPAPGIDLVVDWAEIDVPTEAEELVVEVTASGDRAGSSGYCRPVLVFGPEGMASHDGKRLRVRLERGAEYSAWIAYRIVARLAGENVLRREGRVPWSAGWREEVIRLQGSCLRMHLDCSAPECSGADPCQCVAGGCVGLPAGGFPDEGIPGLWDDAPCDRREVLP